VVHDYTSALSVILHPHSPAGHLVAATSSPTALPHGRRPPPCHRRLLLLHVLPASSSPRLSAILSSSPYRYSPAPRITLSFSGLCSSFTVQASLTLACRLHSQGGGRSRWSARPRPTPKTVRACLLWRSSSFRSTRRAVCVCRSQLVPFSDAYLVGCAAKAKGKVPDKAPAASGSSFNQLLGIKGAKQESVSPPPFHLFPCIRYCNCLFVCELGIQYKLELMYH
jgi:hypothetical protein